MSQFHNSIPALLVSWIVVAPTVVLAQNDTAGTLYGQGVEAFFAGCPGRADSYFSQSISVDPNDPRAYYFRALSLLREGREDEARSDMQVGAEVEARQPNRFAIGKALERVQGPSRLLLEQYRVTARMSHAVNNIPPRTVVEPDTGVLRERRVVPLDEFMQPGTPRAEALPEPAPANVSPPAPPAPPAVKAPANERAVPAPPAAEASPFGDDASPETPAAKTPAAKAPPTKMPLPPQPKGPPPAEKPAGDDNPFL